MYDFILFDTVLSFYVSLMVTWMISLFDSSCETHQVVQLMCMLIQVRLDRDVMLVEKIMLVFSL